MNNSFANNLSAAEAENVLSEAARLKKRARRVYQAFNGTFMIIWGSIYAIACTVNHFWPGSEIIWLPLILIGFFFSYWFGAKIGNFLKSDVGLAYHRLWTAFALAYILLGWGFAISNAPSSLFSFVVNILIAYVLVANAIAAKQSMLAFAGAILAVTNTLFFVFAPQWYCLALVVLGLLAIITGIWVIKVEV